MGHFSWKQRHINSGSFLTGTVKEREWKEDRSFCFINREACFSLARVVKAYFLIFRALLVGTASLAIKKLF